MYPDITAQSITYRRHIQRYHKHNDETKVPWDKRGESNQQMLLAPVSILVQKIHGYEENAENIRDEWSHAHLDVLWWSLENWFGFEMRPMVYDVSVILVIIDHVDQRCILLDGVIIWNKISVTIK